MVLRKRVHYISYKIAPWPWIGRAKAINFLDLFEGSNLKPEKYGTSENRTFPLEPSINEFINTWNEKRYVILKSRLPWHLLISMMMYPAGISHVAVYIDGTYFEDNERIKKFIEFVRATCLWGDFDFSFVAHEDEYESKNTYYVGDHKIIAGGRLDVCLPGIYWVNVFGARYVDWLGENKFVKLPAHSKERLRNGAQMIIARPTLASFDDKASIDQERQIRRDLGERIFFDKKNPNRDTIVPPFASERAPTQ